MKQLHIKNIWSELLLWGEGTREVLLVTMEDGRRCFPRESGWFLDVGNEPKRRQPRIRKVV